MYRTAADALELELAQMIIGACNVLDPPAAIDPAAPLIGPDSPFGLDSLDAVEVVVAVQKKYDVRIGSQETSREVLRSLRILGEFIRKERGGVPE